MPYQHDIERISALLQDIPEEDLPEDECLFWLTVASELHQMIQHASHAEQPLLIFKAYRKAGTQYIWEFEVKDLAKPRADRCNWHGQDVSQWLYAGAILLQQGRVSSHH